MSVERHLAAAQGYLELEMPREALEELDALPAEISNNADLLQLKLLVLMRLGEWQRGYETCQLLTRHHPHLTVGYIHGAFCLHELGRTTEAKNFLLSGPQSLLNEATYHYNLGCYEAVLGNLEKAQSHLKTSFAMDNAFREIARRDPDLVSLRDWLESGSQR